MQKFKVKSLVNDYKLSIHNIIATLTTISVLLYSKRPKLYDTDSEAANLYEYASHIP